MKHKIRFTINREVKEIEVEPNKTLLKMLREDLDLIGAKEGCGAGECGACTVLVDNKPVNSCLMLAVEADGKKIITIEGLLDGINLDPLQKSFIKHNALQCGYCRPGMIISARALLDRNNNPSEEDIKEALAGNLCRCTGYQRVIDAVLDAAGKGGGK
ncbi:MAG: (2Fe-2S)-binding protein [Candidatus Atribacteria bacterium]|nr:MAG: (2Fe-2S)-binding protein [Candidatus Atribacteria bacterium]